MLSGRGYHRFVSMFKPYFQLFQNLHFPHQMIFPMIYAFDGHFRFTVTIGVLSSVLCMFVVGILR